MRKLKKIAENRVGMSQRQLAKKFKVSPMCISRNLKKLDLKYRKRQRAPKYKQKQVEEIPIKCRKLRREITNKETKIIVDDEKYFSFSGQEMPGNAGFYTSNIAAAPDNVRFKSKEKFAPKVLVWLALSEKGISEPFIGKTKGPAINGELYIKNCLLNLTDFIHDYHQNDQIIFWPDNASCHYAKNTIQWLQEHNVPMVPKEANPPNVPKARPIEDFWAILAMKVYEGGWEAKTERQLSLRINKKIKEIDLTVVQTMMKEIRSKLRKIEDKGPFSSL